MTLYFIIYLLNSFVLYKFTIINFSIDFAFYNKS